MTEKASNLTAQLIALMERQLLFGEIRPGERLPSQRKLARDHGVARSTVREAVTELQLHGLVDTVHGGGSYSKNLLEDRFYLPLSIDQQETLEMQLQVMEMRAVVEGEAAYFAALRASDKQLAELEQEYQRMLKRGTGETTLRQAKADLTFHMMIADSSHHLLIISFSQILYTNYFHAIYGVLSRTLQATGRYPPKIGVQHARIFQSIFKRDPESAREAASAHAIYTRDRLAACRT